MDDLGNPNDKDRPFQRRGLLLGDVQSGKLPHIQLYVIKRQMPIIK